MPFVFVFPRNCYLQCGFIGYDFSCAATGKPLSFVNIEVSLLHFNNSGTRIRNHILLHSPSAAIAISSIAPKELEKVDDKVCPSSTDHLKHKDVPRPEIADCLAVAPLSK